MRFNLKNRPDKDQIWCGNPKDDLEELSNWVDTWFEGFEKELREIDKNLHDREGYVDKYDVKKLQLIREILGEA